MTITYGKTVLGQFIYDLGFTKLSDRYLARKHHLPIEQIRRDREIVRQSLKAGRRKKAKP